MDYANKKRLKIAARAEVFDAGERLDLVRRLETPGYNGKIQRVFVFKIEAFDWNCPQHITPRFTEEEWFSVSRDYEALIEALKAEIEQLKEDVVSVAV